MGWRFRRFAVYFQKILKESDTKPNKIWVDRGSEFYNRSMKSWLEKNGIEMYSTHNKGKYVIAERFIRALKNKIYRYMTFQKMFIDKLDDIVNKYNNTYLNTIKTKRVYIKSNTYIESSKEINNKNPKFNIAETVRISKCKNIFAKGYIPNWSEDVFVIKTVKNTALCSGHMLLVILKENKLLEMFMKKNEKKQIKKNLELKK